MTSPNNLDIIRVTGSEDNAFVGIKVNEQTIKLYVPQSYQLNDNSPTFREDVLALLQTLSLAKTKSEQNSGIVNSFSKGNELPLLSYIWLIRDYQINGFHINREKRYSINTGGRVNWKKTIQLQPMISNGNVIYPDMVTEKKQSVENLLVEIHKYCVKKSIEIIGWLFNQTANHIETKSFQSNLYGLYINTIMKEIEKTFDDIKKLRLEHMLNVLKKIDEDGDGKQFVYGVDEYYYIFERMINSIFGTEENLQQYSPEAEWHIVLPTKSETVSASKLRPDTILKWQNNGQNNIFVIDSKYYQFGASGEKNDLPETTSIHKQITYGEFIQKHILECDNNQNMGVYNAFILPYNKEDNEFNLHNNLEYFGYAQSHWKKNDETYHRVHAFLIDLKYVIKTWNRKNHFEDIQNLTNIILEKNSEIFKTHV